MIFCLMYFPLFDGVLCLSLFWYALLCVNSSFAIILKRKKDSWLLRFYCLKDVLLLLMFYGSSSRCRGLVVFFPDHTHLRFVLTYIGID